MQLSAAAFRNAGAVDEGSAVSPKVKKRSRNDEAPREQGRETLLFDDFKVGPPRGPAVGIGIRIGGRDGFVFQ